MDSLRAAPRRALDEASSSSFPSTGRAIGFTNKQFPILPTVGMVFEF